MHIQRRSTASQLITVLTLGIASTLVGGGSADEMLPVNGSVSFDGKLLEYGSVMFQPVGIDGALPARSKIDADGSFSLWTEKPGDGVRVGKCKVRVTAFEAQRTNASGGKHEEMSLGKSVIPQRFQNFATSGIEFDVSTEMSLPLEINLDDYLK